MIIFTFFSLGLVLFGIVMTVIGLFNVSTVNSETVRSQVLEEDRDFFVYLPPGYELSFGTRYPVLYMLDGEVFFIENRDKSKFQWSMKRTLDRLIDEDELEKVIVVGIKSGDHRTRDYTPSEDPILKEGGGLETFSSFLRDELKPYIDLTYRTKTEASQTAIAGGSLGGLASIYIGLDHPNTFSKVGAFSPSLWWDNNHALVEKVASSDQENKSLEMLWLKNITDFPLAVDHPEQDFKKIPIMLSDFKEHVVQQGFLPNDHVLLSTSIDPEKSEQYEGGELEQAIEEMLRSIDF